VESFLDIFGFLSVVLRGLTLALQSLVVGGVGFGLLTRGLELGESARSARRLLTASAVALALSQALYVAADSALLVGTTDLPLGGVVGANFFLAGASTVTLALLVAGTAAVRPAGIAAATLSLGIVAASVATSHAGARLDDRLAAAALTGLHQLATGCWIGGLPYLVLALSRAQDSPAARAACARFSKLALVGVAALVIGGVGLSLLYVRAPSDAYATVYGVMVTAKVLMFGLLLILGGFNFTLVRGMRQGSAPALLRLRRFAEAEIGIGFTVVLTAASLTSQPPAVDLASPRLGFRQIVERMAPRAPRLAPPRIVAAYASAPAETSERPLSYVPGQLPAPLTEAEVFLSEFNHNWAGLVVLVAGTLALLARAGWSWARQWPLAFLVLAVFLFFMADADYWPIGPRGFWSGFAVSEVAQHRLIVPLLAAFAFSEWRVQTGRPVPTPATLIFPLACALGGALLLTHTHSLDNPGQELLAELSHVPIALLGVTAGWSRWLELRLPDTRKAVLGWIWPACVALVGVVLLFYRET